jgi:hypothetical protein
MNKYEELSARLIDMVCDIVDIQHPELNLNTTTAIDSGIEEPAIICGVDYYNLESEIAELIRKFTNKQKKPTFIKCKSCGTTTANSYQKVRAILKEWYCMDCALAYGKKNWVNR